MRILNEVPFFKETKKNTCTEAGIEMITAHLKEKGIIDRRITQDELIKECAIILGVKEHPDAIGLEGIDVCLNKLLGVKLKLNMNVYCENKKLFSIDELIDMIDNDDSVVVRWQWKKINKNGRHSIVPTGYEMDEEGNIKEIIYHDPSPQLKKGKNRKININKFMKLWNMANKEILICERK